MVWKSPNELFGQPIFVAGEEKSIPLLPSTSCITLGKSQCTCLKALRSPVVKKSVGVSVTSVGTSLGLLIQNIVWGMQILPMLLILQMG